MVCPADFDLGETRRVVILSVVEGDDKPLKYQHIFASADLMLLTKMDLLPYVSFDVTNVFSTLGVFILLLRSFASRPRLAWAYSSGMTGSTTSGGVAPAKGRKSKR